MTLNASGMTWPVSRFILLMYGLEFQDDFALVWFGMIWFNWDDFACFSNNFDALVVIFILATSSMILGLGAILNHGEDRNGCGTDAVDEAKLGCDSLISQNDLSRN